MSDFDELFETYIGRLYSEASTPGAPEEWSGALLVGLLDDITGRPVARELFATALAEGFLIQTQAITDDDNGYYAITRKLIDEGAHHLPPERRSAEHAPNYKRFKEQLLISLAHEDIKGESSFFDLKQIADNTNLEYLTGWVRKAAYDFRDSGYINDSFTMGGGEDGGLSGSLTGFGLEMAQELIESDILNQMFESSLLRNVKGQGDLIPASDRLVTRSNNEEVWQNSLDGVENLRSAMQASNDTGDLSENEFQQKLSEVRALQILLDCPQVQWEVLDLFAHKTINYLATKFAENAIGAIATSLFLTLCALLKSAVST